MDRREFLTVAGAGWLADLGARSAQASAAPGEGQVWTVLGPIAPEEFASALCHEHVLVDFIGADRVSRDRYDANEAFDVALPHLRRARELGCRGFVECTPAYLGRDPQLLARLARAADLHILTNTGYYGAAKDQYVPRHAFDESANELADRWVKEWEGGIEGTGVRPGFIKTGVDAGPLSAIDRKLVQAAARTHARTGLTIASHTGDTRAALEQLEVVAREGIRPDAFIWVHAQNDWAPQSRVDAARTGAWVEIDNVSEKTAAECASRVTTLKHAGLLRRLLVSHDAGWYRPGEPRGGSFRGFETVYTAFIPALCQAGWTDAEIRQLMVANPAEAFTVRVRRAAPR
jgi:phosphotriesterase-related protein